MTSKYKDGWYDVVGEAIQVRVENGKVVRATKGDLPASVYRMERGTYVNVCPIRFGDFKRGWIANKLSII